MCFYQHQPYVQETAEYIEEWPLVASNDAPIDHSKGRFDGCNGRCLFPSYSSGIVFEFDT